MYKESFQCPMGIHSEDQNLVVLTEINYNQPPLKLNYGSAYNSIDIFVANHERYDKKQVDLFQNHKPGKTLGERDKDDLVAIGL